MKSLSPGFSILCEVGIHNFRLNEGILIFFFPIKTVAKSSRLFSVLLTGVGGGRVVYMLLVAGLLVMKEPRLSAVSFRMG